MFLKSLIGAALWLCSTYIFAQSNETTSIDLTQSWVGWVSLSVFALAYVFVILEEKIHLRKSKPVLVAASIIWVCIAIAYNQHNQTEVMQHAIREAFLEYAELFFFLLVAMTYINAMLERGVFEALRNWLIAKGLGYRSLFWMTGILAFFISSVANNLTTAMIMCAVVLAVGKDNKKFISIACVNIVVAANAGGIFTPFGDITTLMVWQKNILQFEDFLILFVPAVVNFAVPAIIMHFFIPTESNKSTIQLDKTIKKGAKTIVGLFLATIITSIALYNWLQIPPVFGMLAGLAYLKLFGFYLRKKALLVGYATDNPPGAREHGEYFDVFSKIAMAEWDTLFFFYGVIMAVGGLGLIGYLGVTSEFIYLELGPTKANILVGILSAIVDNIPVMYAVLTMNPQMPEIQWLLVTLTAGVGGSLLSIGSAAGVALMGHAKGQYTFFSHLKWLPAIVMGYFLSILTLFLLY
ncbi:sodium:proton antiporter NhaD [Marinicellulosiphila megalodicopiae]|uniref:sodium:proton antiporter NhaD n=1 Tax=Marinicellulosiphila megalodicopiae TaxID=2724896 RepID=UPI003BB0DAE1